MLCLYPVYLMDKNAHDCSGIAVKMFVRWRNGSHYSPFQWVIFSATDVAQSASAGNRMVRYF